MFLNLNDFFATTAIRVRSPFAILITDRIAYSLPFCHCAVLLVSSLFLRLRAQKSIQLRNLLPIFIQMPTLASEAWHLNVFRKVMLKLA